MKTEIIKQTNEETEYRYCDQSGDAALSVSMFLTAWISYIIPCI